MGTDDPRWRVLPVLAALHDAWWRARGGWIGQSVRPYSRRWEELLEEAGLVSAELRNEAERDVRMLAAAGLVQLRSPRYRSGQIERVMVPLEVERRLALLFGDPLETGEDEGRLAGIAWEPELGFVPEARLGLPADDLLALNRFLAGGGRDRAVVPIKERSIQIFGDEKRLDGLLATALFRPGRLSPGALRCAWVAEPLGWRRGPNPAGPVLILENAATWDSYARRNEQAGWFSAVVYGKGFVISDAVERLADVFREIGGVRAVEYFGDLDPPGLMIPQVASDRAVALGWLPIRPHAWSYRKLMEVGRGREVPWDGDPVSEAALAWLGDLGEPARAILGAGKRLAQEWVGWEVLAREDGAEP